MILDEYFKLVLLIGAVLTFLMAFILWFYPRSFFANKVLGALIFFWGFTVLSFVLQSREFYSRFPHIFGIGTGLIFLFFPLMYVYIRTYLYKDSRRLSKFWMHFIPMIFFFVAFSPFYFQSGAAKATSIAEGIPQWLRQLFSIGDVVIISQGVIYTILSLRLLQHFQYFRAKRLSKVQLSAVKWLKQFVIINVFLWAIGTSGAFIEILQMKDMFDLFKVYYLGLTVLTLWLGFFTLQKPHLFSMSESIKFMAIEKKEEENAETESEDLKLLIHYFETQKPYLDNEMNMQDLVNGSGFSKHRISDIFNNELHKTFYEVINEYRTKEAIRLIEDGLYKQHTLTHLAELAGFNSKATFNRIFKKNTGKTPTEFIQGLKSAQ